MGHRNRSWLQCRRVSKARLVITAVLIEGRSQSRVARTYGVSQSWISKLVARYNREGEAAFEPRSRRPHTNPGRLPQDTIALIVALRAELAESAATASTPPAPHPCCLAGRLHHIGVGRTHAGTRVLMLIQDLNIRIINAANAELIRELTLDPTRDYQPRGVPPGPKKKKPEP